MTCPEPTADELLQAYKQTLLRREGVSLQKAMSQQSTSIELKILAIVRRNKKQQPEAH